MRRIIGFVTMFFLAVTVVFGKSQENIIDITFNKLGAVYHKNESGNSVCKVIKANNDITYKVVVEIVDIDKKPIGYKKTYTLSSPFERYYYVPFQFSELGYYYLSVSFLHGDKVIFSKQEGFGVIPERLRFSVWRRSSLCSLWRLAGGRDSASIGYCLGQRCCEMERFYRYCEKYARSFYRLFRPSQYLLVAYFRLCGCQSWLAR